MIQWVFQRVARQWVTSLLCLSLSALLVNILLFSTAWAHTQEDERRVLLQISPTAVELVVHWTMKTGVEAADLRQRLDINKDKLLTLPGERLAQVALFMPRLQTGLTVWLDGQQLHFEVAQMAFKDAKPWRGPRTGFEGLVLFRAPAKLGAVVKPSVKPKVGAEPSASQTVVVALGEGPPITVEAQAKSGLVLGGDLPTRAGDPVLGPKTISQGSPQVRVTVSASKPR